jgi:TatD DNase family protein
MYMIDAHAHLIPNFVKNINKIIENARSSGVQAVINSAIEPRFFDFASKLEKKNTQYIFTTLGFAPQYIKKIDFKNAYSYIRDYESLVAIGEVGLDYHWINESFWRKKEKEVFSDFISLANERQKPLVIHSRKAENDCIDILEKSAEIPILMHCFAGNMEETKRVIDSDWLISIPTAVTNRKKHRRIARNIPLENIVVETDTPFLSPIPGKKNEPANIKYAIEEIAKLKDLTFQEVDKVTSNNAQEFYQLHLEENKMV